MDKRSKAKKQAQNRSKPGISQSLSLNGNLLRRASETIDSLGAARSEWTKGCIKTTSKTVQNPAISSHFL
jgi:hypothetical protein